jgi:hypothetical protein
MLKNTYTHSDRDSREKQEMCKVKKKQHDLTCFSFIRIHLNAGNKKLNGYHISWYYAEKEEQIPFRRKKYK